MFDFFGFIENIGRFVTGLYPVWLYNSFYDSNDVVQIIFTEEVIVGWEVIILTVILLSVVCKKLKHRVQLSHPKKVVHAPDTKVYDNSKYRTYLCMKDEEKERDNYVQYKAQLLIQLAGEQSDKQRAEVFEQKFPEVATSLKSKIDETVKAEWRHECAILREYIHGASNAWKDCEDINSEDEYIERDGKSKVENGLFYVNNVYDACWKLYESRTLISEVVGEDITPILNRFHDDARGYGNMLLECKKKYAPVQVTQEQWSDGVIMPDRDEDDYHYSNSYSSTPSSYDSEDYSTSSNNNWSSNDDSSYGDYEDTSYGSSYGNDSSNSSDGYADYSDYWHNNNGWSQGLSGDEYEDQWHWQ